MSKPSKSSLRNFALLVMLLCGLAAAAPSAQFGQFRRRQPRSFYSNLNRDSQLRQLFPRAASFSPLSGTPPHISARAAAPATGTEAPLLGYAFWTTDLVPNEIGYHGPIRMLVGMTPAGVLTGIVVDSDTEPYGYFSVETPQFAAQFAGKSIRDNFRVGVDVDAVSRASISISSATRAIRDSSRMVARALLKPSDVK
jgi:NosR/NirI family transcriptional regulator, nitrous oxide reductase regulator